MADSIVPAAPGVYRLLNRATGKCYVGSTANLRARRNQHMSQLLAGCHHSTKVRYSAAKHGSDQFVFEVLSLCSVDDLLSQELHWMTTLDSVDNGYNIRRDPARNTGNVPTAEARMKMSLAGKGRRASVEARRRLSEAAKGRDMTKQVIISADRRRGRPLPETTRSRIAAALTGKKKSPEHVAKVIAANKQRPKKPKPVTLPRGEKLKGVPQSPEHVAKRMASFHATMGRPPEMIGVSWHAKKQRWRVRVHVNGKETSLGYFKTVEEAIAARKAFKH